MVSPSRKPRKVPLPFERYKGIPPPGPTLHMGQTGLETHTSSAQPWISLQGLTITSPALCILYRTVFTVFLLLAERRYNTGGSLHKTQASYSNWVAIRWERNSSTAWEVVKPSSETVQSKWDARTQNEAAQDKVSQKGLIELNQALCSEQ